MCDITYKAAKDMGIRTIRLRSAQVCHMELSSNHWHFRLSAKEQLKTILQSIFAQPPPPQPPRQPPLQSEPPFPLEPSKA